MEPVTFGGRVLKPLFPKAAKRLEAMIGERDVQPLMPKVAKQSEAPQPLLNGGQVPLFGGMQTRAGARKVTAQVFRQLESHRSIGAKLVLPVHIRWVCIVGDKQA
jgi:hypothetical protein